MPIGTAFHERTFAACESLNYREWSGYYTVSTYETHHEHEYNTIRNAAGLIDISPLFKYRVSGPDATRLVNRVITRDAEGMAVSQVYYTRWRSRRTGGPRLIRACGGFTRTPLDCASISRTSPSELPHWRCRGRRLRVCFVQRQRRTSTRCGTSG